MRFSTRIGKLFGIDIFLHWSFVLIPILVIYSSLTNGRGLAASSLSLLLTLALFGCVLLHELGHALTARRFGIRTRDIVMLPIGGLARLERMPRKPSQEFLIAIAGPAVNVVIAGLIFVTLLLISPPATLLSPGLYGLSFFVSLMWANILLVAFNMLPAFPMDGGRVVRSLLAMLVPYEDATLIAGRLGQVMAVGFGIVGILWQPTMILIAMFVFFAASSEIRMVRGGMPLPYARRNSAVPPVQSVDPVAEEWQKDSPSSTRTIRMPNGDVYIVRGFDTNNQ